MALPPPSTVSEPDIKKLLAQNIALSQQVLELNKKIYSAMVWGRVWTVVKILMIVVPLVLGVLYLPSLLDQFLAPYQSIINSTQ